MNELDKTATVDGKVAVLIASVNAMPRILGLSGTVDKLRRRSLQLVPPSCRSIQPTGLRRVSRD